MAIESGTALAIILSRWRGDNIGDALAFYKEIRKPRTDRITQTSFMAGKLASSDNPEGIRKEDFDPEVIRDRMKWIMNYDLIQHLSDESSKRNLFV